MHIFIKSNKFPFTKNYKTHSIYFFYFHENINEDNLSFQRNKDNNLITKIFIFSTKDFSERNTDKINYILNKNPPSISIIADFIDKEQLKGYIIIGKPNILFNKTLNLLKNNRPLQEKSIMCLNSQKITKSIDLLKSNNKLLPQCDILIFHSSNNISKIYRKIFGLNFQNKDTIYRLLYLFMILNYKIYNNSGDIECYSLNKNNLENYNKFVENILTERKLKRIDQQIPLLFIEPYKVDLFTMKINKSIKNGKKFNLENDNSILINYINDKLRKKEHFIIPRIAGVENNLIYILITKGINSTTYNWIKNTAKTMKNNAGVQFTSEHSLKTYATNYIKAFNKSELYTNWHPIGQVYRWISESSQFMEERFKNKKTIWALTYDIYHNIYGNIWTHSLKGKRILIISAFSESYKKKYDEGILPKIYNVDLFPECKLLFITPPKTQGTNISKDWMIELDIFNKKIERIKDNFDIALVSAGGYGNIICSNLYDLNKSAIYVGGVLQMYFGIYGRRWMVENKDILNVFLNEHWSRPKDSEKPKNYKSIEEGCYF